MVMHARKLPRISDGFTEKHQTHGYENPKYSNKYRFSNHDKNRDSPSSNSLRSSSPDSRSQSPRYHKVTSSNYYKLKDRDRENRERERDRERERERDRDREREYRDYRDRDESRSPKDRRRDVRERDRERERDHRDARGNHVRMNSVHKKEEKERLTRVGEWSEHVSSCGKKYYYNCETEVSQWEKPSEWMEWERSHRSTSASQNHTKESLSSVHRSQHDKSRQEKHSTSVDNYREGRDPRDVDRNDRRDIYRNDDHYDRRDGHARKYPLSENNPISDSHNTRMGVDLGQDKCSLSSSHIPSSSSSHIIFSSQRTKMCNSNLGPLPACLPSTLPGCGNTIINSSSNSNNVNCATLSSSQNSAVSGDHINSTLGALNNSVPPAVPQLLNSHPRLLALSGSAKVPSDHDKGPNTNCNISNNSNSNNNSSNNSTNNFHHIHMNDGEPLKNQLEPLTISANSNSIGGGPPTPTHSENQDCIDVRKVGSPNSSINSLQSLTQSAGGGLSSIRANVPALTPSLANYYKETLISHVQSWPAEMLEKQSQRLSEEAHTVGSLIMTKVSTELKMARSLVRLAEIQATLHEQRILFLRAQKQELEEVKSQNCFMSDT